MEELHHKTIRVSSEEHRNILTWMGSMSD